MGKNKKQEKIIKNKEIRKTTQKTISLYGIYLDGTFRNTKNYFTRSYYLNDVNFKSATEQEQNDMYLAYGELLNSFNFDVNFQITINNHNIDEEIFKDKLLMKKKYDDKDRLRDEYNEMLLDKAKEGNNNLKKDKILTIGIIADTYEKAKIKFSAIETSISKNLKKIYNSEKQDLFKNITLEERLNILYNIYNSNKDYTEYFKKDFDYMELTKKGTSVKDIIAPQKIEFLNKDYYTINNKYYRNFIFSKLPSALSTEFFSELTSTQCNMITSIHYQPTNQAVIIENLSRKNTEIKAEIKTVMDKATNKGSIPILSSTLTEANECLDDLLQKVKEENQKIFFVTPVVTIFSDTKEQLDLFTEEIEMIANKYLCKIEPSMILHEQLLNSAIPYGLNEYTNDIMLTTQSASIFFPFEAQELFSENGTYYGLNANTGNLIMYDETSANNGSGLIFGSAGSGKSFLTKRTTIGKLLDSTDNIYFLSPEPEYNDYVQNVGGTVVKISVTGGNHINPLDITLEDIEDDESNPILMKTDLVCGLFQSMLERNLYPKEKTLLDACVKQLYEPLLKKIELLKEENLQFTTDLCPTLMDLYNILLEETQNPLNQETAYELSQTLALYTTGQYDLFAYHTNIDIDNRIIVFDIHDLNDKAKMLKEIGLRILLDHIWNKVMMNYSKGIRTRFYIDEFHVLLENPYCANFIAMMWKRIRKYGGMPIGITQDIIDVYSKETGVKIFNNSELIIMLKQAPKNREILSSALHLSPDLLKYVANPDTGSGLLFINGKTIQFKDQFPTNTELFKLMDTNFNNKVKKTE